MKFFVVFSFSLVATLTPASIRAIAIVRDIGAQRNALDASTDDPAIVELLTASLQRVSEATAESVTGASICAWDTFRTVHPLLTLIAPAASARVVSYYIEGWKKTGFLPECSGSDAFVRGGGDAMITLGDFAAKYGDHAAQLGITTDELYEALIDTATQTPVDWNKEGRQNTAWTEFNYIPTAWNDPSGSTGLQTREVSRTLEYALGDFALYQAAEALQKPEADVDLYQSRSSLGLSNVWSPTVTNDGFRGFVQRRYANGSFAFDPPNYCSPIDTTSQSCGLETDNNVGIYKSSSWEMSFYAPHAMAKVIELMGSNETFITRLDHYFSKGYFTPTSRPSFGLPWAYHYANRPDLSALRVRQIAFTGITSDVNEIVSSDSTAAMSALTVFHILGLYPTPFSWQLLVGSPMISSYTLTNDLLGTTTKVTVDGFDKATLSASPPDGSRLFVKSISVNGQPTISVCWLAFEDLVGGGEIVIEVDSDAAGAAARGCDGYASDAGLARRGNKRGTVSLPDSMYAEYNVGLP